ncbi:MAG: SusE domain-containing protein [Prolixibacteraceae bacterium]
MKRILNIFSLLAILFIAGCELEPEVQIAENPVPPQILMPTEGHAYAYTWDDNNDTIMIVISQVQYGFPVGVTYTAEFDADGGDFERSRSLGLFSGDTLLVPIKKFNTEVKKLKFVDDVIANLDLRISCFVSKSVEDMISPVINISFVPYSEPVIVEPVDPEPGLTELYLIGASTGAWDTERAVALTAGDAGMFTGLVHFNAAEDGRNFRFFTKADWASSYGGYDILTTYPEDLLEPATADSDPNFNFIGTTGWYNLTVNTVEKAIAMTASDAPELYLTGDATHGWDFDEPVSTVYGTGNFVYEGDIEFIQDLAFRVFAQKDWAPNSYGWDYLTTYDEASIGVMEGHDDPNWQFLLESGMYHVKIDMKLLSIEITK